MVKKSILCLLIAFSGTLLFAKRNYDIVVSKDGSGNFTSIQEAISSVGAMMTERKTIFIKNGIYNEKIIVPTHCLNISLIGENKDSTIISWADHADMPIPGTETKMGTFNTYTLLVQGHGFRAENICIENNAPQLGQAVALHVEGDKAVFVNCKILGNQDTIYAGSETSRQYYNNCYIEGTIDIIFGSATAYFDKCHIHCKKDSYITAPSTPEYKAFGFIFNNCIMTADSTITKVYLGRPWRPYGNSVFVTCSLGDFIAKEGWDNWHNPENEKTARFIELGSTGPGANNYDRVAWAKPICDCKASYFSVKKVLSSYDKWNPEN